MNKYVDLKPGVPVILADGLFPESRKVLEFLRNASAIICCDGATVKLVEHEIEPSYIVGDMDSLPEQYKRQFETIISSSADQYTNDLTKAVIKALELGFKELVILGATGLREDHTLGNIGLLAEHGKKLNMQIISDFGVFTPIYGNTEFSAFKAQQVSMFSILDRPIVSSNGLKYPLKNMLLENLWNGTLNESLSESFSLEFDRGCLVVFRAF